MKLASLGSTAHVGGTLGMSAPKRVSIKVSKPYIPKMKASKPIKAPKLPVMKIDKPTAMRKIAVKAVKKAKASKAKKPRLYLI